MFLSHLVTFKARSLKTEAHNCLRPYSSMAGVWSVAFISGRPPLTSRSDPVW